MQTKTIVIAQARPSAKILNFAQDYIHLNGTRIKFKSKIFKTYLLINLKYDVNIISVIQMDLPSRKPNRLENYDYGQIGCYFVTLCTHNRQRLFSIDNVGNGLCVVPYKMQ